MRSPVLVQVQRSVEQATIAAPQVRIGDPHHVKNYSSLLQARRAVYLDCCHYCFELCLCSNHVILLIVANS